MWKIKSDHPRKWFVSWPGPDHGFWQNPMIREPNSSKIAKLKTLLASWFRSKCSKNFQKIKKSAILGFFDDFRGRWARRLGIYHFLKNVHLRVTNDANSKKVRDFSWGDRVFLFVGTWKTHFYVFSTLMQFCFEKTLTKHWNSIKNMKCIRIEGKIGWWKLVKIDEKHSK